MSDGPIRLSTVAELEARHARVRKSGPPKAKPSTHEHCTKCGRLFVDLWEQSQHEIVGRHHYRSWTAEDGRRMEEQRGRRMADQRGRR